MLALSSNLSQAENGVFYLGAGFSYNTVNNITDLAGQDLSAGSWKAFAAVRPINLLAVEADFMDLGGSNSIVTLSPTTCVGVAPPTCSENVHSHGRAYASYLVGFVPIPLPIVDVYGKAGAAHWRLSGTLSNFGGPPSSFANSGTDFAWSIGVQAHVRMVGVRLEYENFNVPRTSGGGKIASLSVFWNPGR